MTKIYLIRHAEAEGNLYRIAHGWHNGLITNYRGYQQIDALRQRFQDVDIDAVYASDLYGAMTVDFDLQFAPDAAEAVDSAVREMKQWVTVV